MIERLLAEGKLVEVEKESRFARATYRYRGFVVVQWNMYLHCIRPCEVGRIPPEMLDFAGFRGYDRTHHYLADDTETACLCFGGDIEEILAHIDSWWAGQRAEVGGER